MAPSTAIHYTPMWICYGIGLAIIAIGETLKKKHSGSELEKGSLKGV
jgi:teichuronic acid biosynthesis protein TuaE